MITGSEIWTHYPLLSFVVTEISRNKMVVPEVAAGLSINPTISISWVYYYYYYCHIFIAFTSKVLEHVGVWCGLGGITQIVIYYIWSRPNSSLNHANHIFVPKLYQVDSLYTAGSKLQ